MDVSAGSPPRGFGLRRIGGTHVAIEARQAATSKITVRRRSWAAPLPG
jgi:hypothetical protein